MTQSSSSWTQSKISTPDRYFRSTVSTTPGWSLVCSWTYVAEPLPCRLARRGVDTSFAADISVTGEKHGIYRAPFIHVQRDGRWLRGVCMGGRARGEPNI